MYKNILVPVEFDHENAVQAALPVARKLAAEDAVFTLVHVLENIPAYVSAQIPDELLSATRREVDASLAQLAESLKGAKTQLLFGNAGRSIVDFADANDVDCIVLASHKPGIANMFLGSTASRVVRHAKCAVHVVR